MTAEAPLARARARRGGRRRGGRASPATLSLGRRRPARSGRPGCRSRPRRCCSASARLNAGVAAAVEAAHVEVVDHLVDAGRATSSTNVGVALDVAGDAEAAEHLLAEAVGGGDRRRVEVGQRPRQPLAARPRPRPRCRRRGAARARRPLGGAPASAGRGRARRRPSRSRTRSRSSPVAIRVNVTSSSCVERHALGDVARGQRGDRVGLAGAGAGLEHGDAGWAAGRRRRTAASSVRLMLLGRSSSPLPQPARQLAEAASRSSQLASTRRPRRGRQQLVEASARRRARAGARRPRPPSGSSSSDSHSLRPPAASPPRAAPRVGGRGLQASGSGSRMPRS